MDGVVMADSVEPVVGPVVEPKPEPTPAPKPAETMEDKQIVDVFYATVASAAERYAVAVAENEVPQVVLDAERELRAAKDALILWLEQRRAEVEGRDLVLR